jgi:hypothetical protein
MNAIMRKLLILTIIIGLLGSCQSSKVNLKRLDKTNPKTVAEAVLKSYQKKDLETLKVLASQQNAKTIQKFIISDLLVKERRIFTNDQWEKIKIWDGEIKEVRFSDDLKRAYAMFDGDMEGNDSSEISVVKLILEQKEWRFDNIVAYTRDSFDSLGYVME